MCFYTCRGTRTELELDPPPPKADLGGSLGGLTWWPIPPAPSRVKPVTYSEPPTPCQGGMLLADSFTAASKQRLMEVRCTDPWGGSMVAVGGVVLPPPRVQMLRFRKLSVWL